jgi:hypothetical protein
MNTPSSHLMGTKSSRSHLYMKKQKMNSGSRMTTCIEG